MECTVTHSFTSPPSYIYSPSPTPPPPNPPPCPSSAPPLVLLHAVLYQLASTPPNKSPSNGRYDASEAPWIRIAPFVFQLQQPLVWLCTSADILLILSHHLPIPALRTSLQSVLCPSAPPSASAFIRPTLPFFTGLALVAAGTLLRLT
ncbi:hypothetical protein BN946_scf184801.g9 [Trametes cinnabarina]|uniref:Uncharacterized protein n=1 Tax=Pycnoporus cinnabarinus TaxID=5643 RepID=A0A060SEM4_PYCCI|nr:hypothetical protein BN946_scf184801.g9 [Trametes cinnabarina]